MEKAEVDIINLNDYEENLKSTSILKTTEKFENEAEELSFNNPEIFGIAVSSTPLSYEFIKEYKEEAENGSKKIKIENSLNSLLSKNSEEAKAR